MRRSSRALVLLVSFVLSAVTRAGAAEPVLRIRGQAIIDATAGWLDGHLIVSGSLRDDTGRPLAGAVLTLHARGSDAKPAELPAGVPCSPLAEADKVPQGGPTERSLRTDRSGRFCVDFAAEPEGRFGGAPEPPVDVELRYADGRGLFDAAARRIAVERNRRGVELRFVEPPAAIDLDAPHARVEIGARAEPAVPSGGATLPIVLYARSEERERVVAQVACRLGGTAVLSVPTSELGAPGPLDLVARFAGTESFQPAETARRVSRVARVALSLGRPAEPSDPESGVTLDLAVGSSRGAVASGSVEARLQGETVGIAKVESGTARVVARFARRAEKSASLTLHYLPSEPWWIASSPLRVEVTLAPRSHWGSLAWLLGFVAIAAGLLRSWRRPARAQRETSSAAPKPRTAAVVVVEADEESAGWRGVVRDAHDETPVGAAEVAVVAEEPEGSRVVARTATSASGEFELPDVTTSAETRFVITARWHATLRVKPPPHGRLEIDLVTRRRQLVARFVAWAARDGHGMKGRSEPTPGDVREAGKRVRRPDVVAWANAVETAAYGPEPVDEPVERRVLDQEPPERSRPPSE
ncbi:MAG TPA: hypothetical protein VFZ53_05940 [Polyangiaceae bacterium]